MASFRDLISPANIARQFLPQGFLPGTPGDGGGGGFMPNINLRFGGGPEEAPKEEALQEDTARTQNAINNLLFLEQFSPERQNVETLLNLQQLFGRPTEPNLFPQGGRGVVPQSISDATTRGTAFDAAERTNQAVREDAGRTVDQSGAFDAREPDPKAKTEAAKRFFEGRPYPGDAASQELAERLGLPSTKPRAEDYFPGIERQKPFDTTTAPQEIVGARPAPEFPGALSIFADLLKNEDFQRLLGTGILAFRPEGVRGREAAAFTGLMDEASKRRLEQQKVAFDKEQARIATELKERGLDIQQKTAKAQLARWDRAPREEAHKLIVKTFVDERDKFENPDEYDATVEMVSQLPGVDGDYPHRNLPTHPIVESGRKYVAKKAAKATWYGEEVSGHLFSNKDFEALDEKAQKGFTGPMEGWEVGKQWALTQSKVLNRLRGGKNLTREARKAQLDSDPELLKVVMRLDPIGGYYRYIELGDFGPELQTEDMIRERGAERALGVNMVEWPKVESPSIKVRQSQIAQHETNKKEFWTAVVRRSALFMGDKDALKSPLNAIQFRDRLAAEAKAAGEPSNADARYKNFMSFVGNHLQRWIDANTAIERLETENMVDTIALGAVKSVINKSKESFNMQTGRIEKPINAEAFLSNTSPTMNLQDLIEDTSQKIQQLNIQIAQGEAITGMNVDDLKNQRDFQKKFLEAYRHKEFRALFLQNYNRLAQPE